MESITIQFTKLQLTQSHIDDSQSAKITVTVDLEPYGSEQIEDTVKLQNGESTSLRSSEINPIILDELTIPTNVSAVQGTLNIKIDHSDITETYNQKFSVTGAEFVQAEGGTTVTDETINGQKYRIHAFESTGKDEFKVNKAPFNDSMDILLVAGGDSGDGKDYSNKFTEQFGEDGSFAGGGGGTGEGGYQDAGDGGSGIILIRYPIE